MTPHHWEPCLVHTPSSRLRYVEVFWLGVVPNANNDLAARARARRRLLRRPTCRSPCGMKTVFVVGIRDDVGQGRSCRGSRLSYSINALDEEEVLRGVLAGRAYGSQVVFAV